MQAALLENSETILRVYIQNTCPRTILSGQESSQPLCRPQPLVLPLTPCSPWHPQEQMEDMRKKEEHLEKEMTEVAMQNRRLADPLQKAREEMSDMQKKLGGYERDKQILVVGFHCIPSPPWCEGAGRLGRCLPSPRAEPALGAPGEVLNPSVPYLVTWGHMGLAPVLRARWPLAAMVGLGPLCLGAVPSDDHLTWSFLGSSIVWVPELGVLSDPSLQCTKARLKVTEKELKSLRWEHEVLEQRFIKVGSWGVWGALGHLGGSRCVWGLPGHLGDSQHVWGLLARLGDWVPGSGPSHSAGLSVDKLDVSAVPHCCPLGPSLCVSPSPNPLCVCRRKPVGENARPWGCTLVLTHGESTPSSSKLSSVLV